MKNRGFTTTETMVALGVLGVLAVIAVPSYGYYTKKTQVTEAFRLMDEQRAKIEVIKKLKSCTASSGVPDSFVGKYGTLVVSGNYVPSSGPTCPTGCVATFTVNDVADKELQIMGVIIVASIVGLLTMIPGGLGTFDTLVLIGLKNLGINPEIIGATIIIYRLSYYVVPFSIGCFMFLSEGIRMIKDKFKRGEKL